MVVKPLSSGGRIWLTRAFPFVTWGPEAKAALYATERHAWEAIARLGTRDAEGARVVAME